MYAEPKTWYFPENLEAPYHATPHCPDVLPQDRRALTMVYGAPEERWPCDRCCPAWIVLLERQVARPPVRFHADDECPELKVDAGDVQRAFRLEDHSWPSRTYAQIVSEDAFTPCRVCIPDPSVLHSLGSPQRRHDQAA